MAKKSASVKREEPDIPMEGHPEAPFKPPVVAKPFDVAALDLAAKKAQAENRPPADPIEHFRKVTCQQGHADWDPKRVLYSIDHRSWLIYCTPCEAWCAIPAGAPLPLTLPGGMVPVGAGA